MTGCQQAPEQSAGGNPTGLLELHSAYGSKLTILGSQGTRFEEAFNRQSDDGLRIKFYEPGALFAPMEGLDRVGQNRRIATWASPGYFLNKDYAFAVFGGLPFSPPPRQHLDWLRHGGGQELMDMLFARYNAKAVPCSYLDAEGFGWFHSPIRTMADLKGLRMRFFGLGARVMERAGVDTVLMAGSDIYPALRQNKIQATEFSTPYIDRYIGFHRIAKTYYYPGWHQPLTLLTVLVNLDTWNAMTPGQRQRIEDVCAENIEAGLKEIRRLIGPAIEEIRDNGASVLRTPTAVENRLREIWENYAAELGRDDPEFRKVYESLRAFEAGV